MQEEFIGRRAVGGHGVEGVHGGADEGDDV